MDQLLQFLHRERATTTPVDCVSFDERSHKLVTLAVEASGRLGREASEFIDQLATSVFGGRNGGATTEKDIQVLQGRCFTDSLSDLSGC